MWKPNKGIMQISNKFQIFKKYVPGLFFSHAEKLETRLKLYLPNINCIDAGEKEYIHDVKWVHVKLSV